MENNPNPEYIPASSERTFSTADIPVRISERPRSVADIPARASERTRRPSDSNTMVPRSSVRRICAPASVHRFTADGAGWP